MSITITGWHFFLLSILEETPKSGETVNSMRFVLLFFCFTDCLLFLEIKGLFRNLQVFATANNNNKNDLHSFLKTISISSLFIYLFIFILFYLSIYYYYDYFFFFEFQNLIFIEFLFNNMILSNMSRMLSFREI